MATLEDVRRLAALARIEVRDAEIEKFSKEFEGILSYVGQIEGLEVAHAADTTPPVRNVFRDDGEPHASGIHTEALTAQFPERDNDALKVKQIVNYD